MKMATLKKIMWRKYRKLICVSCVFLYLCTTTTFILTKNVLQLYERNGYPDYLLSSLHGPMKYDNPLLVDYVANEILVPPSTLAYNLKKWSIKEVLHKKTMKSEEFYRSYVKSIFNDTRNGFFIEAGALDGEAMSNTLWLEKHQGWTGLLVEPEPSNFKAMLSKNRKAWSANACLSVESYPKVETLSTVDNIIDIKQRAMGSIFNKAGKFKGITNDHSYNSYYKSQCFPLGSFLLALNVTKIDLLSLDVEFVEEFILRNFDFEKFDVQVLFIEYYDFANKEKFHRFLVGNGYEFIANHAADVIYCKNGTELSARLSHLYPSRTFTNHILRPPKS